MPNSAKICKVALSYMIHNLEAPQDFLVKLFEPLKNKGFETFATAKLNDTDFSIQYGFAGLVKQSKELEPRVLQELQRLSRETSDKDGQAVAKIKSFKSKHINNFVYYVNQYHYQFEISKIKVGKHRVNLPTTPQELQGLGLSKAEQNLFCNEMKPLIKDYLETYKIQSYYFMAIPFSAYVNDYKLVTILPSQEECPLTANRNCRNEFMYEKIRDLCVNSNGKILVEAGIAFSGLSEKILNKNTFIATENGEEKTFTIDLKHIYPANLSDGTSFLHKFDNALLSQNPIVIFDTNSEISVDRAVKYIVGESEHTEL